MPNPISLMMVPWEPSNRPPSVFLRVFVASAPSLHCRRLKTNRVRGIIRFLRDRWRISLPLSFEEKSDHWTELTLSMFLVCIFFQSRNSSFLKFSSMRRGSNYVLYACIERLCSIVDHERVARLRRVDFITAGCA